MKRNLFLLIAIFSTVKALSQERRTINFNRDWEMYIVPSSVQTDIDLTVRNKTDFNSQFNHEHIELQEKPIDSVIIKEINTALHGYAIEYPEIAKQKWEKVTLPHPARYEQKLNPAALQFTGICYYRKLFEVQVEKSQLASIKFEGVMQQASVWVNGRFVMQNQGGYLPFTVPLNPYLKAGENEIILRVDNSENSDTPPGKPLSKNGFLYWSGIYRDVKMEIIPGVHITDPVTAGKVAGGGIFVRYDRISACAADVLIQTHVKNTTGQSQAVAVKHLLLDKAGNTVFSAGEQRITLETNSDGNVNHRFTIENPNLWSPDDPYLYTLVSEISQNGIPIDQVSQKTGIRHLSFSRWEGFKLNGNPLRIVGTNRHEDHPYIGNSLSAATQYRDLKRIKAAGMNFVRIGHYPNAPGVYNICDSLGLMVVDPIPGWQFFNKNEIFRERVFQNIRQMVRRDRNHPCVILWEASLNESNPPDEFRVQSALLAHEEFPGDQFFTSGDSHEAKTTAWDVPYNGWQEPFGRPQNVQADRPGFVREYGDYEFGGSKSTTRVNRSQGEKALLSNAWNIIWEHNLLRGPEYYPFTIGDANWAFYDGFEGNAESTSDWGVMDVFRIPKFVWYFFQSQQKPYSVSAGRQVKPMVYIANWWTQRTMDKVVVFSNCDEIELFINGKPIGRQKPDNGFDSPYGDWHNGGNPFDGGNCRNLDHPPFTFTDVTWESGELKAIGYIQGQKVEENIVRTPETTYCLKLEADMQGKALQADGADAVFVHARIVDKSGTVICADNTTVVKFEATGEAVIPGPVEATARGGIASILVRSTTLAGKVIITAQAKGLKKTTIAIASE